jgi:hypothetical protein
MARKAKVVAPVVSELIENEVLNAEMLVEEVEVEEIEAEVVQPSVLSSLVSQLVKAPAPEVEVKKEKNDGVGLFIRKLIGEGLGNKAILEIVHEQYGNKNTSYACVAWYRNNMKKTGKAVAKSSALDFVTNFAKVNNLSEQAVEELLQRVA